MGNNKTTSTPKKPKALSGLAQIVASATVLTAFFAPGLVKIKFKRSHPHFGHFVGDEAEYAPEVAKPLLEGGFAEEMTENSSENA